MYEDEKKLMELSLVNRILAMIPPLRFSDEVVETTVAELKALIQKTDTESDLDQATWSARQHLCEAVGEIESALIQLRRAQQSSLLTPVLRRKLGNVIAAIQTRKSDLLNSGNQLIDFVTELSETL